MCCGCSNPFLLGLIFSYFTRIHIAAEAQPPTYTQNRSLGSGLFPRSLLSKPHFSTEKKNLGLPGLSSLLKVTWLSNGPAGSQPRSSDTQSSPFPTNYFNFLLTSSNEMGQSFSSPEAINSESAKQGPGCNPCVAFWGDLWAPGKRGPQLDCLMEPRGVSEEGKLGRVKGAGLCLPSSSRACILKATC